MKIKVWEVYEENSTTCAIYLTEELANNQTDIVYVDFICSAVVSLSDIEIERLNKGLPLWL